MTLPVSGFLGSGATAGLVQAPLFGIEVVLAG